jgi:hypothetical protein
MPPVPCYQIYLHDSPKALQSSQRACFCPMTPQTPSNLGQISKCLSDFGTLLPRKITSKIGNWNPEIEWSLVTAAATSQRRFRLSLLHPPSWPPVGRVQPDQPSSMLFLWRPDWLKPGRNCSQRPRVPTTNTATGEQKRKRWSWQT